MNYAGKIQENEIVLPWMLLIHTFTTHINFETYIRVVTCREKLLYLPRVEPWTTDLPAEALYHYAAVTGINKCGSSIFKELSAFIYVSYINHI